MAISRLSVAAASQLPDLAAIARFWRDKNTFVNFDWEHPGCFACNFVSSGVKPEFGLPRQWRLSRLQRCHLISRTHHGPPEPENLVLLCRRCHRDAPMIGVSPQPMIDWINRRQGYAEYFIESFLKECRDISPSLLEDLANVGWKDAEELTAAIRAMAEFMKVGYMAGEHLFSSMALVCDGILRLRIICQRKQSYIARRTRQPKVAAKTA